MLEPERDQFEDHYFSCHECAEEVRIGMVFRDTARSVFAEAHAEDTEKEEHSSVVTLPAPPPPVPESGKPTSPVIPNRIWQDQNGWFEWLRPSSLIPMAASVSLAFIAGWQALVTVPELRRMAAPQVASPVVLAAATRGELPVIAASPSSGLIPVSVYLNGAAARVAFELRGKDGTIRHSGSGAGPAAGAPLVVFLPASSLKQPGEHVLQLRDPSAGAPGTALGEYRFLVERK